MNEVARECGYLTDWPDFVDVNDIDFLPREETLLIVTGSQGEPQAALSRIASGDHRDVRLEAGDTVIFSSKEIPGNEKAIGRIQNRLAADGIRIITEASEFVHVSGHPARDELKSFYEWVRPPLLVPIHGETRHLKEHLAFARACGIPDAIMAENGSMLRLAPGPAEIVDEVFTGRMAVDGKRLIPVDGDVIRARRRIGYSGIAVATIVLDKKGRLHEDPQLSLPGLADGTGEDDDIHNTAIAAIADAVEELSPGKRADDEAVEMAGRRAIRQTFRQILGRRPHIEIHIVRL
jgi:ribonuclease J